MKEPEELSDFCSILRSVLCLKKEKKNKSRAYPISIAIYGTKETFLHAPRTLRPYKPPLQPFFTPTR